MVCFLHSYKVEGEEYDGETEVRIEKELNNAFLPRQRYFALLGPSEIFAKTTQI